VNGKRLKRADSPVRAFQEPKEEVLVDDVRVFTYRAARAHAPLSLSTSDIAPTATGKKKLDLARMDMIPVLDLKKSERENAQLLRSACTNVRMLTLLLQTYSYRPF